MDAGLGEEVGRDLPWQSADVSETVVEALVTEAPSRREPTARTVRLPVYVSEQLGQLNRAAQRLRQGLEREPTAPELAEAVHLSVEQVHAVQIHTTPVLSLDTPIADSQSHLRDVLAERIFRNPLDTATETELSEHVQSCLQTLTPRKAYIVRARSGSGGWFFWSYWCGMP